MRKLPFKSLSLSLCAVMGITGCQTLTDKVGGFFPSKKEAARESYCLHVGDELEISFGGTPGSAVQVRVEEDGSLFYPPVGTLHAEGLTLEELGRKIQSQLLAAAAPAEPSESPSVEALSPAEAAGHLYQFQQGDEVELTVWDHSELTQKIQVREDGVALFPLIGNVSAAGRTLPDLEKEVTERLDRDYIIHPQVTLHLIGAQFSMLGQKGESGSYPIENTMDLLTALSKAGDIATLRSSRIEIIRQQDKKRVVIEAHVDRILHGSEPNLPILPRDTIYVQGAHSENGELSIRMMNAKFTALGEIGSAGTHPIEGPMDLLTALSLAGGITKFGSNRVELIRMVNGKRTVIHANVDRVLQGREPNPAVFPRDTLYVRRRLF